MKSSIRTILVVLLAGAVLFLGKSTMMQAAESDFVFTLRVGGGTISDQADVIVGQTVFLSGYAQGAERYEYFILLDGIEQDYESYNTGQSFSGQYCFDEAGDYEIYATAYFKDADGNETSKDSTHYHVYADYIGTLDTPQIDGPAVILDGADYVFSILNLEQLMEVEGAEWDVSVGTNEEDTGSWIPALERSGNSTNIPESFTVPAGSLEAGTRYEISVLIDAPGWESSTYVSGFYVTGELDNNVNVTIAGMSSVDLYLGDSYTVRIEAPGASAVKFFSSDYGFSYALLQGGTLEIPFDADEAGTKSYFAMVCYESVSQADLDENSGSLNWGGASTQATVSITSLGQVDAAEFSAPETVVKGEPLPITITSLGNAEQFDVRIVDENDTDMDMAFFESTSTPFGLNLFTGSLEVGERYYVVVNTYASRQNGNTARQELEVTEPGTDIKVVLARNTVPVTDMISGSVYASGAEKVKLEVRDSRGNVVYETDFEGDYLKQDFSLADTGTYTVYGGARYSGGDTWTFSGKTQTLKIVSAGILATPSQTWPSIVMAGEQIQYSFEAVEHADFYRQMLYIPGEDELWIPVDEAGTDHVHGSEDLPSGVVYGVEIVAYGKGYAPSISEPYRVAVVDPSKILILPSDLTTIESEAFMGIDAQLVVLPESVAAVEPRAFASCPNLIAVVSPNPELQLETSVFQGCPNRMLITQSY